MVSAWHGKCLARSRWPSVQCFKCSRGRSRSGCNQHQLPRCVYQSLQTIGAWELGFWPCREDMGIGCLLDHVGEQWRLFARSKSGRGGEKSDNTKHTHTGLLLMTVKYKSKNLQHLLRKSTHQLCHAMSWECWLLSTDSSSPHLLFREVFFRKSTLGIYHEIHPLGCIRKSIPRDISGNPSLGIYQEIHP